MHILAWASALPSDTNKAMREASRRRTATDTDSYAFFFLLNANEGMTEGLRIYMGNISLTKLEVENRIRSEFRKQFPNLNFCTDIKNIKLEPNGQVGFNPIPAEIFCGEGTYLMHGWASIFGNPISECVNSFRHFFDVEVKVEKTEDGIKISFQEPIIIRSKR